ncbi:c-type cytochrome [Pseudoduganella sp. LjRoot289]|uniref:cytochrome c oxidase subunit II n=1 Tax=Pseudoduganella sp. LjRoot289 TaxID=3342314 RepID=UPI003ECFB52E
MRPRLWIVGGGLLLPVSVLSALMAYNVWRSAQLGMPSSRGALVVSVTAKMWWWEVRYQDASGEVVLANELHLPLGRPVYLALTSSDVIHSFWVPALAGKVDMVPGRMTGLSVRATKEGVYRGQCAEYCGTQHARMALHVVAERPEAFAAWLARQAQPAAGSAPAQSTERSAQAQTGEGSVRGVSGASDGQWFAAAGNGADTARPGAGKPEAASVLARGREAFSAHCAVCHTIRGVSQQTLAGAGPDLTHVGSRLYLAAGTLRNQPGALAAWIADPQAHKAGARMPSATGLDGTSLLALAAYLEQLK